MERRIISGILLVLLFVSMVTLTFNIQSVKSDWTWTGTIYIRADGSVDPDTAPITSADNITYTLTDNIIGDVPYKTSAIVVEKDDIVVDGAGYTLRCVRTFLGGTGVYLGERNNVTLKNMKIKSFYFGITLNSSSYNTISGNSITASYVHGIHLLSSSNNKFYHNNLLGNTQQVYIGTSGYANIWDDGYPSGGNFWSDYEERYPGAEEIDESGIWDTPYVIDAYNQDNYPLMGPLGDVEPPVADAGPDQIVGEGMTVTFDGSNSTDDIAIKSYVWNFTDTTPKTLTGMKPNYIFENVGDYEVTLNVSDYVGNWDTDTVTITVLPLLNIYIRADGSVDPDTAPITSADNITYTLTDHIYGKIVVERDNIVVEGASYTLQGAENGTGIDLTGRSKVEIKNMGIKAFYFGISLSASSNNTISGNNIINNDFGIFLDSSSFYNTISGNNVTNNDVSIVLEYSSYNTISGNNIKANSKGVGIGIGWSSSNKIYENHIKAKWNGIMLRESSNNNIYRNDITDNNKHGIWIDDSSNNNIYRNNVTDNDEHGIILDNGAINNTLHQNKITENIWDGILINLSSDNNISVNDITDNGCGIELYNSSSYNTISENHIKANRWEGILLNESSYNTIYKNDITGNDIGISFSWSSSNNIISGNHIKANNEYGIWFSDSSNNKFFHNNFIDNTEQIHDLEWDQLPGGPPRSINTWDDGYPSGGNYWSDYSGTDGNGDGIGDSAYTIDSSNQDRYPLMNPVVYDVAVTNVAPLKTVVGQGYPLRVNVTILNQGNFTQTFDVMLYANTTSFTYQEITLTSESSTTITITWNVPIDFVHGNFTISAKATRVPGETDTTDNTYVDGTVIVTIAGDVDGDCDVDYFDLGYFADAYASHPGDSNWDSRCDFDDDGDVDYVDLSIFADNYTREGK